MHRMSGVGVLVGIGLFGVALLGVLPGPARSSDGAPPINLPPGFAADVFAADLGAPRALAVDPAGTLIVSIPSRGQVVALPDRGAGRAVEVVTLAERLHLPTGSPSGAASSTSPRHIASCDSDTIRRR